MILNLTVSKISKTLKEVMAMLKIFKDFIKEEKGQTLVEWNLILALIIVVIIGTIKLIGVKGKQKSDEILRELS